MERSQVWKGKSLKQVAYETLAEWLIEGKLKAGQALVESELATQISASRTPIREALFQLAQEGLVEIVPRRGAFVSRVSLKDIQELFEIREALESTATRIAAEKARPEILAEIEEMFERADYFEEEAERFRRYEEAGDRLHDHIIEACGNERIAQILDNNRTLLRIEQHESALIPGEIEKSMREHREILKALQNRDAKRAKRLMEKHIVGTLTGILESYQR